MSESSICSTCDDKEDDCNTPPVLDLDGGSSGFDFKTGFVIGGSAVAIADADVAISDPDDTRIQSACIRLTNAKAGDVLLVGTLPAGISAAIDTSVQGEITVALSGLAGEAAYQTALKQVFFKTTSADLTEREVTTVVVDAGDGGKVCCDDDRGDDCDDDREDGYDDANRWYGDKGGDEEPRRR
jgi:hypothetical protein